ncbi:MAG: BlaI/MecI/CopY family transcriptional regulator [Clostridia bacterium]|nr:BlaI/MecI/CopY family transcriptional regulator [Clostridia bacterium]
MNDYQMGAVESRFADIIWTSEPLSSSQLAKMSEEAFNWKKSTTYTVLKRLCDKGIFKNEKGTVTSVISRDEFYSLQSENFVKETFGGSLPAFLTAFTKRNSLTQDEADALRRLVKEFDEKEDK